MVLTIPLVTKCVVWLEYGFETSMICSIFFLGFWTPMLACLWLVFCMCATIFLVSVFIEMPSHSVHDVPCYQV